MQSFDLTTEQLESLAHLAGVIRSRPPLVAFTGAGISTESGIPDYRGPNGLWTTGSAKPVTYEDFMSSEQARLAWWHALPNRYAQNRGTTYNAGHSALVELERAGILAATVTQNIDGLHQRSGVPAAKIIELHGNTTYATCLDCGQRYELAPIKKAFEGKGTLPLCEKCDGIVKTATIPLIDAGETKTVTFTIGALVPFGEQTTVKVDVDPVPGETNTSNNSYEYPVIFTL